MTSIKIKTSIALDKELFGLVDVMIKKKRFANRTHAIEYAVISLKEQIEMESRD